MPVCSGRALNRLSSCKSLCIIQRRRAFASAALAAESISKPQALTLHHKVSALLPRILPAESLSLWNLLLDDAYEFLSKPNENKTARVVVYGVDEFSGARDLVTALLDDTISSDPKNTELLYGRPKDATIAIENDQATGSENGRPAISSRWLQQFPVSVQIIELPHTTKNPQTLLTADFPIVVVNPVTTPLSSLDTSFLDHPNAILVIVGIRSPETDSVVRSLFADKPTVLYIDPFRALASIQAFKSDPSSLKSIDTYQYGSTVSGINDLSKVLLQRTNNLESLKRITATSLLQRSLNASRVAIHDAKIETNRLCDCISHLKARIEDTKSRVQRDTLGTGEKDDVKYALDKAKAELALVLENLKWWTLLWRVDEVGEVIGSAVDRAWCKELEQRLILHTGRISALQAELATETETLLTMCPLNSPYHSPVLANTLSQLSRAPTYPLTPASLTGPLLKRKMQLAAYPTTRLHIKAQRIVLGMYSSAVSGLGLSWAGWVGLSEPLLGLGAETSLGAGLLGAVLGVRWGISSWENAKKKWRQDLDRVGDGLSRDLVSNLERKVKENVISVPETACDRLDAMVDARKEQIAQVEEQVGLLQGQSRQVD